MVRPGWAVLVLLTGVAASAGLLAAGAVLHPPGGGALAGLSCTACHGGP